MEQGRREVKSTVRVNVLAALAGVVVASALVLVLAAVLG